MSIVNVIKAHWQGFVGGPDFKRNIQHRFILENKQLSITIPDSNVAAAPSKIDANFPHTFTSWFAEHVKTYKQHSFVRIVTENWMYMPPIAILPSCEFGMLSCQLRIKQTDKINVLDEAALSHFVIQEYDEFHNGPEGTNTETRKKITERLINTFGPKRLEEEITYAIEHGGGPSIPASVIKMFNNIDWVFYQEIRSENVTRSDYYCLPLSKNSFLEVEFRHRIDRSDKHKKWAKHALESQERIMSSIYLDDLPAAQAIDVKEQ